MVVGEFAVESELVVIGGGPGGYSAAFRAAELGIETTIVDDRQRLGGTWLHAGCILSKHLVHLAQTVRAASEAAEAGVAFGPPRVDVEKIRDGLRTTVTSSADELEATCEAHGITRVRGSARFESSRQISTSGEDGGHRIRFKNALVAPGATHGANDLDSDDDRVMTPADAIQVPEIPATLLVVGSNVNAMEIASVYAALGSHVTIVDSAPRLLPRADPDLVALLVRRLARAPIDIRLRTRVIATKPGRDGVRVEFAAADDATAIKPATFDRVLVATGRVPNLAGLGLERTKVTLDARGFIQVDEQLRTRDPRIFAVGDVIGRPMLALKASHQGHLAAEVIAGWGSRFDVRAVPMVVFTDPQIAWCGLMEEDLAARNEPCGIERICWSAAGLVQSGRGHEGFTKIMYEPDTRLVLGVGIVGANAAELIGEAALAIEMGAVTTDLASTIHPHPTRAEHLGAAARKAETSTRAGAAPEPGPGPPPSAPPGTG